MTKSLRHPEERQFSLFSQKKQSGVGFSDFYYSCRIKISVPSKWFYSHSTVESNALCAKGGKKCKEQLIRLNVFLFWLFSSLTSCAALSWSALICVKQKQMSVYIPPPPPLHCLYIGIFFCSSFPVDHCRLHIFLWIKCAAVICMREENVVEFSIFIENMKKKSLCIVLWEITAAFE